MVRYLDANRWRCQNRLLTQTSATNTITSMKKTQTASNTRSLSPRCDTCITLLSILLSCAKQQPSHYANRSPKAVLPDFPGLVRLRGLHQRVGLQRSPEGVRPDLSGPQAVGEGVRVATASSAQTNEHQPRSWL